MAKIVKDHMLTNKEIAERLRREAAEMRMHGYPEAAESIEAFADELDPPRPEPGTVVWWRYKYAGGPEFKYLGIVEDHEQGIYDAGGCFRAMQDIEYKPARILAPDEVAVKVPPVREWPSGAAKIGTYYYTEETDRRMYQKTIITRAEAQQREREAGR